jgi:hypothetical protein
VAHPLLVDQRAMDMGIYVLISTEPAQPLATLRAHVYEDVLLRFCAAPFQRASAAASGAEAQPQQQQTSAVVVGRAYTSAWEMPSLLDAGLVDNATSGREALERHLARRKAGTDLAVLWSRVDHLIATVLRQVSPAVSAAVAPFLMQNHTLFELVRLSTCCSNWDFPGQG